MTAIIRELTVADLPDVLPLGREFFAEANLPGEFSDTRFAETWTHLLSLGIGRILGLIDEGALQGVLGFVLTPDPCVERVNASEMFWFVTKPARKGIGAFRLLDAYERTAFALGAASVTMAHVAINSAPLSRLFRRRGYSEIETLYRKDLWQSAQEQH